MRRAVAGVGRALVTLGLLIFLFVGYQLWGTGIWTARAQSNLKHDFSKAQRAYEDDTVAAPTTTTTVTPSFTAPTESTTSTTQVLTKPGPPIPPEGEVEGILHIPKIGLTMAFVEGTGRDDLKKGPGHYPDTPMPGTIGNAAIAGHRTTYLHPFYDVDKLQPGDEIIVDTVAGTFTYEMTQTADRAPLRRVGGCQHARPAAHAHELQPEVLGIAAHRDQSQARAQQEHGADETATAEEGHDRQWQSAAREQAALEDGLVGQQRSLSPTVLWGIIAALVGGAWWWFFRRWRHPSVWVLGLIPFLLVLFPFYVYLERALPAGY